MEKRTRTVPPRLVIRRRRGELQRGRIGEPLADASKLFFIMSSSMTNNLLQDDLAQCSPFRVVDFADARAEDGVHFRSRNGSAPFDRDSMHVSLTWSMI